MTWYKTKQFFILNKKDIISFSLTENTNKKYFMWSIFSQWLIIIRFLDIFEDGKQNLFFQIGDEI